MEFNDKYLKVSAWDEYKENPWTVFSAGADRTGTFIAIDILLEEVQEKGGIDVYSCVQALRESRMQMVHTLVSFCISKIL